MSVPGWREVNQNSRTRVCISVSYPQSAKVQNMLKTKFSSARISPVRVCCNHSIFSPKELIFSAMYCLWEGIEIPSLSLTYLVDKYQIATGY